MIVGGFYSEVALANYGTNTKSKHQVITKHSAGSQKSPPETPLKRTVFLLFQRTDNLLTRAGFQGGGGEEEDGFPDATCEMTRSEHWARGFGYPAESPRKKGKRPAHTRGLVCGGMRALRYLAKSKRLAGRILGAGQRPRYWHRRLSQAASPIGTCALAGGMGPHDCVTNRMMAQKPLDWCPPSPRQCTHA